MPFRDLTEEAFLDLYKEVLSYAEWELTGDQMMKLTELKIKYEIAKQLKELNERLRDGLSVDCVQFNEGEKKQ